RSELALRPLGLERIDVGHRELRARGVELATEVVADVAYALDGHVHVFERAAPELDLHAGLDAASHAERGEGRGVAGAAAGADDLFGDAADDLHVFDARAGVLGGVVLPAEAIEEAAEGAEDRRPVEHAPGPDEHRLSP